jgi:hypothetical protein
MDGTGIVTTTAGILIGYFSSEVPTGANFERLFWPQRFYYAINPVSLLNAALLMPIGGVLHKAVLEALDQLQQSGLLSFRRTRGHMLGTPFYSNTGYQPLGTDGRPTEPRNGFWISVLEHCARNACADYPKHCTVRSIQTICALTLTLGDPSNIPRVLLAHETRTTSLRPILGILASESFAIGIGLWAVLSYRTWFACLWFIPVTIKLLSLLVSFRREPLDMSARNHLSDMSIFHFYHPRDGLMVIRGPAKILDQFLTHYGHPLRSKPRELLNVLSLFVLDLVYPCGMTFLSWVPRAVQIAWLAHLLFVTVAMHVYRYHGGELRGSIQEMIGSRLLCEEPLCVQVEERVALLAKLSVKFVNSVSEGCALVSELLKEFESAVHGKVKVPTPAFVLTH